MMKRSFVALGILGLVCALALPAANAAVLYKDDFSTDALLKSMGTYTQGVSDGQRADPTVLPWVIKDGVLECGNEGTDTNGSDGVSNTSADPASVRFLLLTGDAKWADVAIQSHITVDNQNTGVVGLVLRAAPKTKVSDPDTWYEFRYTTGTSAVTGDEDASGIAPPDADPNVRLMKVVNGKWTMLAETDNDRQSNFVIPAINAAGADNATGAIFRFVAKGNLLQGLISMDGKTFTKVLEATDDELKAGVAGLDHYDYNPVFDDLLIEDAP